MAVFDDCVCIAQARVIAGFKREPHICTIAYQPSKSQFLRLCIPFVQGQSPTIKRWRMFSFEGVKDGLGNDTRDESWQLVRLLSYSRERITQRQQRELHCKILASYRYESELNEQRDSIGLLIPIHNSLRLIQDWLSPKSDDDAKELQRVAMLKEKGIWYPSFKVRVKGKYLKDGTPKSFDKQVLAWDVYEALRIGGNRNPFAAIYSYRNPYMIIGNLATHRNSWVVVGILSAPDHAIEHNAFHQQLAIA
jgi:hypothetical protein